MGKKALVVVAVLQALCAMVFFVSSDAAWLTYTANSMGTSASLRTSLRMVCSKALLGTAVTTSIDTCFVLRDFANYLEDNSQSSNGLVRCRAADRPRARG